ncbi:MAG: alpha/beta fold hydrolase [Deltaproteobacteria bacterium]|nr:alpha/beta fold hydrolase [Deltaproteobacteria bacterium]
MRRLARLGLVAAVLLIVLIVVGPAVFQPTGHRLALAERPSDYGLRYEAVTFSPPDRPITLRAWWIPAENARAALIFVHGGGDDNRNLPHGAGLALARDLVAQRYALLMVDLRNFGESDGTEEGITYGDLEVNDVVGAIDFLAARARDLPTGAIGFSMGGATVLRAAARDRRLRAVVADSAFADARAVAVAFTHAATGLPTFLAAPFVWSAEHLHGVPLARGATVAALRGATLPSVLLIHDCHDPIAPVADCGRFAATIPTAVTWITDLRQTGPFGTHIQAYRLAPEAYVARVAAFLDGVFAAGSVNAAASPALSRGPSDGR